MKYLFTVLTSNDLGLVTRSLPIAAELKRRGHLVAFCNPAASPNRVIRDAGFQNYQLRHPFHYLSALQERGELSFPGLLRQVRSGEMQKEYGSLWKLVSSALSMLPTHIHPPTREVWSVDHMSVMLFLDNERLIRVELEALLRLIQEYQPDVIVDSWHPLACLAARIQKKPLVTILQVDMHPANQGFIWWKSPPSGLPSPVPTLNKFIQRYGLPSIHKIEDLFLGDLPLILGIPETDPLPAGARGEYIGAVLWQKPGAQLPQPVEHLDPVLPTIWIYLGNPRYFSFRSPFDTDTFLAACIRALADEPLQVVLSTGHHPLPVELQLLPKNFLYFPFVPGLLMAQHSQLMIHHGGYGSCQTGLYTGTPAIILPTYSERESNARRVVQAGAGEMILPSGDKHQEISPKALKEVVQKVLINPDYQKNASRVAQVMQAYGGATQAADLIENLGK